MLIKINDVVRRTLLYCLKNSQCEKIQYAFTSEGVEIKNIDTGVYFKDLKIVYSLYLNSSESYTVGSWDTKAEALEEYASIVPERGGTYRLIHEFVGIEQGTEVKIFLEEISSTVLKSNYYPEEAPLSMGKVFKYFYDNGEFENFLKEIHPDAKSPHDLQVCTCGANAKSFSVRPAEKWEELAKILIKNFYEMVNPVQGSGYLMDLDGKVTDYRLENLFNKYVFTPYYTVNLEPEEGEHHVIKIIDCHENGEIIGTFSDLENANKFIKMLELEQS